MVRPGESVHCARAGQEQVIGGAQSVIGVIRPKGFIRIFVATFMNNKCVAMGKGQKKPGKTLDFKTVCECCDCLGCRTLHPLASIVNLEQPDLAEDAVKFAAVREQKQRFIDDLDGSKISSTELVNRLPNGQIQTVNSMKYPTREIKLMGINFKYHYLRHTYGTMMAELNTPQHLLCAQMGHAYIHVTQKYYLAVTKSGVNLLKSNINLL